MKLVLLGSTGFLGTANIEAALKRSVIVTAIAMDIDSIKDFTAPYRVK